MQVIHFGADVYVTTPLGLMPFAVATGAIIGTFRHPPDDNRPPEPIQPEPEPDAELLLV